LFVLLLQKTGQFLTGINNPSIQLVNDWASIMLKCGSQAKIEGGCFRKWSIWCPL